MDHVLRAQLFMCLAVLRKLVAKDGKSFEEIWHEVLELHIGECLAEKLAFLTVQFLVYNGDGIPTYVVRNHGHISLGPLRMGGRTVYI